jgi:hypothetical protein
VLDAYARSDVVDVADDVRDWRLRILPPIGSQKADVKVDTHQPITLTDGV